MNVVIDDAEEIYLKKKTKKAVGMCDIKLIINSSFTHYMFVL